jgi:RND family efflux transporter MFP subunit
MWKPNRLLIAALPATVLAIAVGSRIHAQTALRQQTSALSVPTVSVVTPKPETATQTLDLPASIQPFQDAAVYARTSGYVLSWKYDIGSAVKVGDVLATITSPEVDAELARAEATEGSALADYLLAKSTAARWQVLAKTDAVSQQDVDQTLGAMKARDATLAAARADVARLKQLHGFDLVRSPFNGVVTARGIDTGSLIDPGSGGGPRTELFHVMQTDVVRVFVDVPQNDVADINVGTQGTLTLSQWPGRPFPARVSRTSQAIDPTTRTLRIELDVPNPDRALLPGAYAMVHLQVSPAHPSLSIPVSALLFRPEGVQVATVNEANRVSLQPVTLGRDFGTTVEVTRGLEGAERVVANPTDGVASGDPVRIAGEADHV